MNDVKTKSESFLPNLRVYLDVRACDLILCLIYCCPSDTDFTENCILANFNSESITGKNIKAIEQG